MEKGVAAVCVRPARFLLQWSGRRRRRRREHAVEGKRSTFQYYDSSLTVIHRRDKVMADQIPQKKLFDRSNVTLRVTTFFDKSSAMQGVAGVRIKTSRPAPHNNRPTWAVYRRGAHHRIRPLSKDRSEMKG